MNEWMKIYLWMISIWNMVIDKNKAKNGMNVSYFYVLNYSVMLQYKITYLWILQFFMFLSVFILVWWLKINGYEKP